MEEKNAVSVKKPWPSRLADSALRFVITGVVLGIVGILFASFGGVFLTVGALGVIAMAFVCSIVSLIGLVFYKFKVPGAGKVALVMIASYPILALAYAIESPAFSLAKARARKVICKNNLVNLNNCFQVYCQKNNTCSVPDNWCDFLMSYFKDEEDDIYKCPTDKTGTCSYAMNENIPADANELPSDLVLLFESKPGWNQTGSLDDVVTDRHGENNPGANIVFADGHVKFVPAEDIPNLRWTVDE